MAKIKFIQFDGTENIVDADNGTSVMRAAIDNLIPGIDADCGGECSCATCRVMIDPEWVETVGQPSSQEESMLDLNPDRGENSRLSCQLIVSEELDGIVVTTPESQ